MIEVETAIENKLFGPGGQPIAKSQMYALLVDENGDPVLDTSGNRQVVAIQSTNGKMQTAGDITNSSGSRSVYVQASMGDEENFVNALATSGFMLQYNPVTGKWQRFTGKVQAELVGSLANLQGIVNTVTAGVRIPLSANQACSEVTITAKRLNTGYIYVGNASVSSTAYGIELEAKDSITIRVANLNQIYIDSSVNGEGVSYVAI